jgi:CRP-like cAMP-binding protein
VDPGEIFGELAVTGDGDADEYAEATEPSTIVLFSADALRQVVEKNAGLAMGITRFVGFRRQRIKRRLQDLLFRSTQDRLTHLLLELAADYGRRVLPDATELSIRLSHLELASIIGSTREGVTLLLEKMQSEGLINVSRRRITIRSLNGLVRIVQTRPQYALEMASTSE